LVILNLPAIMKDNSAVACENDPIGKRVGFIGNGDEAEERSRGWYVGKVKRQLTSADKEEHPNCTHWIAFHKLDAQTPLPQSFVHKRRHQTGEFAALLSLTSRSETGATTE
jgi:hypothetical protein